MSIAPEVAHSMHEAFGTHYQALAFSFELRTDVPGLAAALDRLLSEFKIRSAISERPTVVELRASEQGGAAVDLLVDDQLLVRAVDAGSAVDQLIAEITARAVRSNHPYVALHAGAVSHHEAGALIPGPSGSGKSTLTSALVRESFGFLSDEVALVEPGSLRVHPFRRPVALSPGSMLLMGMEPGTRSGRELFNHFEQHLTADDIRPGSAAGPVQIRFIVVPEIVGDSVAVMEAMSRGEALELLLSQCFELPRLGGRAVVTLGELVKGAEPFRLRLGDVSSAVHAVQGLWDS